MLIVGISAYYHDAAAVLLDGGAIVAAAQEERFSRRKHDPAFPAGALRFCLDRAGVELGEVGAVVFYDKPFLKFERILETFLSCAPRGLRNFVRAMPVWLKEKLLLKSVLRRELAAVDPSGRGGRLLFSEHHLSHAASAFYPSPFEEAAILTVDGVGEWATASIARGRAGELEILRELHFPHSLGLFYSAVTQFLGFRVNADEYKVMGLAPYGADARGQALGRLLRQHLIQVGADGAVGLGLAHYGFQAGNTMVRQGAWERILGMPARAPGGPLEQGHADLALAAQRLTEEAMVAMAVEARRLTGLRRLCLAGGVALNCVANRSVLDPAGFEEVWIQPAAGDAGGALGAALAAHHLYRGATARRPSTTPGSRSSATPPPGCWTRGRWSAGSRGAPSGGHGPWETARSWPTRGARTCSAASTWPSRAGRASGPLPRRSWPTGPATGSTWPGRPPTCS